MNQKGNVKGMSIVMESKPVKVVAVTGGKGGIGKSNIAINMAIALANRGDKVLLFDADLGLGNVDVLLGLTPKRSLTDVFEGKCSLDDTIVEGPSGISIIPSSSGHKMMAALDRLQHIGLIRAFSEVSVPHDVLVIDTAAGISDSVISFSKASQQIVVVVCDEPSSLADAYALIKLLNKEHGISHIQVVCNMVRSQKHGKELFAKMLNVANRFLDVNLELMAVIPYDENIKLAIRKQKAVLDMNPRAPSSMAFVGLANKVANSGATHTPLAQTGFYNERLFENNEL